MRVRNLGWGLLAICGIVLSAAVAVRSASTAGKPATRPTSQPARPSLTLATYNMNYGISDAKRLAEYVRIIRKSEADVVAIQEGNAAVWAYLKRHLAKDYPHMKFYPGQAATGFAWLSKTSLTRPVILPRSYGWFITPTIQVKLGDRTIRLVNIHLRATIPPKGGNTSALLKEYGRTELIRAKEIRFIYAKLSAGRGKDLPTVLLGDFNSMPAANVPLFLASKGYVDGFASVTKEPDKHPSWHWGTGQGEVRLRLDYVWHDANFRTRSAKVLVEGPSDHWPVVCELELLDKKATGPTTGPASGSAEPTRSR